MAVPNAVEIKMTRRGFEVTAGGRTASFPALPDAVAFAQRRLEHAQGVRDLRDRCE
jgi:hypothetical protein